MNQHQIKFIFVTGGVVSSLGKGVTAASLATLLECRGIRVTMIKMDPYINIDPGTMSPLQHGEVFVTEDGAETDMDLGHYERFIHTKMTKLNNFTAGQVYQNVIENERRGDYLGATVQIIPHITDMIKQKILQAVPKDIECAIIEVGGTVGDIESLPFLEAIRQLSHDLGHDHCLFLHLTLLPYIQAAGEIKTKPTQHSVKELRGIGIQPDMLVCRCEKSLTQNERKKIALFTNVPESGVFSSEDVFNIYEIPQRFHDQEFDLAVLKRLGLPIREANLTPWNRVVCALKNPEDTVTIAMIGKYVSLTEAYKSLNEALLHAGIHTNTQVHIRYIDSEMLESEDLAHTIGNVHGILVPGGFGQRGSEGKIRAIAYARHHNIPFLGICLGMQLAVVEYARHALNLPQANSTEFLDNTPDPVIALITEWDRADGTAITSHDQLGGTMRLGAHTTRLQPQSLAQNIYGKSEIKERHRHRYEVNSHYISRLTQAGLKISGLSEDGTFVEIVEVPDHPWFLACQFHPEFQSTPRGGHPLFTSFTKACLAYKHALRDSQMNASKN